MRRKRYTETQIVRILKEIEGGQSIAETSIKYGVHEQTINRCPTKYDGMEVSDFCRLKELDEENRRLKKLLEQQVPENDSLKDLLSIKVGPSEKRMAVWYLKGEHGYSERLACRMVSLPRSVHRYQRIKKPMKPGCSSVFENLPTRTSGTATAVSTP